MDGVSDTFPFLNVLNEMMAGLQALPVFRSQV